MRRIILSVLLILPVSQASAQDQNDSTIFNEQFAGDSDHKYVLEIRKKDKARFRLSEGRKVWIQVTNSKGNVVVKPARIVQLQEHQIRLAANVGAAIVATAIVLTVVAF